MFKGNKSQNKKIIDERFKKNKENKESKKIIDEKFKQNGDK